jgi:hypothetical protein
MSNIKDIKVTFLNPSQNNATEKIRIFFKDVFKNDVQIDLRAGEIVYSQTNHLSNSLKIYSRKGMIKIEEQEKPVFLNYYVGYKLEEIDDKYFLYNLKKSLTQPIEKDSKKSDSPEKISALELVSAVADANKETVVDKAKQDVSNYSSGETKKVKKKYKSKKGPGRPKKRGPKKGLKRKKSEE